MSLRSNSRTCLSPHGDPQASRRNSPEFWLRGNSQRTQSLLLYSFLGRGLTSPFGAFARAIYPGRSQIFSHYIIPCLDCQVKTFFTPSPLVKTWALSNYVGQGGWSVAAAAGSCQIFAAAGAAKATKLQVPPACQILFAAAKL